MSAIVLTTCERCGDVEVCSCDITVMPSIAAIENVYSFDCPSCAEWIVKEADPRRVALLLRVGAHVGRIDCSHDTPQPMNAEIEEFDDALRRWIAEDRDSVNGR